MTSIIKHLAETAETIDLGFPTVVIGAIAMVVFIALGLVTYSYRDVANRHEHKSGKGSHH
ncbi:MAG: hypothetical protein ACKOWE_04850 [Micrococcales bacterium]